ncbi:uncharacterized protein LOC132266677 [Cornus florida]|uniref:uncharacterized protein LOC132266677 n=1 Tax=Cornus florida TaxID=4283 RepID=UPI0028A1C41C|nr:uncharacterized protein LOC132266677 [Cornus florida]
MPTYTAIALDRLIEPGASKSMEAAKNAPGTKMEKRSNTSNSKLERGMSIPVLKPVRGMSVPNSKLERRNTTSITTALDKKHHWAQISPALYATPEPTPLPDSPSSFPPSPYIINHKRRGPRLLKSSSVDDVATRQEALDGKDITENSKNAEKQVADSTKDVTFKVTVPSTIDEEHVNDVYDGEHGSNDFSNGLPEKRGPVKTVAFNLEREGEVEDFLDPQESMSVKSTEAESSSGVERSLNLATPMAEFYDAWEELSSESAPQLSLRDVEAELRDIRLSLLMEIEKRKQAEEDLSNTQSQWLRIRDQLSLVGITLPADLTEHDQQEVDPAEEVSRQVYFARFVSNSIGRGTAKAEVEMEMDAQIELKNFEIARLCDRLHYYEAVNREMSQRNQEAVETTRRLRQRRKRRQRWVWGSIAATITLGTAALAWSYLPTGKGSSSTNQSPEGDHPTE